MFFFLFPSLTFKQHHINRTKTECQSHNHNVVQLVSYIILKESCTEKQTPSHGHHLNLGGIVRKKKTGKIKEQLTGVGNQNLIIKIKSIGTLMRFL